ASGITVRFRYTVGSASPRRHGRRSRCTTRSTKWTGWGPALVALSISSAGCEAPVRLEQIYQEVILDHYKHPHRRGLRDPYGAEVAPGNPICGDEGTLRVALSDDGERVADVSYDGQGCSISQAATSVLTDQVIGQT